MIDGNAFANGFGTHIPALAAAVSVTTGPVLELGSGNSSTPLLHAMCEAMQRYLLTVDHDASWLAKFAEFGSSRHRLVHVPDWRKLEEIVAPDSQWGLVLIDHAPEEQRLVDLVRFADRAEFVVAHDSNAIPAYAQVFARYKHRLEYTRMSPHTALLSNRRPFPSDAL